MAVAVQRRIHHVGLATGQLVADGLRSAVLQADGRTRDACVASIDRDSIPMAHIPAAVQGLTDIRYVAVWRTAPHSGSTSHHGIVPERADSLIETNNPVTFAGRRAIVEFAARERLAAVYSAREFADAGGLLACGTDIRALYDRLADYVDKLLKGARVADLPFEHPTEYELVVNLNTARALGLTVPRSMLLRSSDIIQ